MTSTSSQPRVWMITGAARGIGLRIVEAALAAGDSRGRHLARRRPRCASASPATTALLPLALDVTERGSRPPPPSPRRWRASAMSTCWSTTPATACWARLRRPAPTRCASSVRDQRVRPAQRHARHVARRCANAAAAMSSTSRRWAASAPARALACTAPPSSRWKGLSEALHGELAPLGVHVTDGRARLLPYRVPRQHVAERCRHACWPTMRATAGASARGRRRAST